MGSAWGLSTNILCQAVADSKRPRQMTSLEIEEHFHQETRTQIARLHLEPYLEAIHGDAVEVGKHLRTTELLPWPLLTIATVTRSRVSLADSYTH